METAREAATCKATLGETAAVTTKSVSAMATPTEEGLEYLIGVDFCGEKMFCYSLEEKIKLDIQFWEREK